MENENKNHEHKIGCAKILSIIAIIISVISIALSAFTLGTTIKNNKECPMPNMQNSCPVQDFMPMWPMDNHWRNNDVAASSSTSKKRKGGYSPFNKAYDKKPVQEIDRDQSPQEYETFDAPDSTYGEILRERERLKKEKQ
ncbi:MAG: hypothetical protein MJ151_01550 [Lachnospiraceae bacterium]|nr:hypothetical protein [Lachnospiraceae bacterium]